MIRTTSFEFCVGAALAAALVAASAPAQAQPSAPVALETELSEGALECTSRDEIVERISAKIGRNPFTEDATRRIRVAIDVDSGSYTAQITIEGSEAPARSRALGSDGCQDLVDAVVFTTALAIDPVRSMKPEATWVTRDANLVVLGAARAANAGIRAGSARDAARVRIEAARSSSSDASASALARLRAERHLVVEQAPGAPGPEVRASEPTAPASAWGWAVFGAAGVRMNEQPVALPSLGLGLQARRGGLRLVGTLDATIPAIYPTVFGGQVSMYSSRLSASVCHDVGSETISACAMAALGRYVGESSGHAVDASASAWLVGAGASAAAQWALSDGVWLRVQPEVVIMANRIEWAIDETSLFTSGLVEVSAQAHLVWRL